MQFRGRRVNRPVRVRRWGTSDGQSQALVSITEEAYRDGGVVGGSRGGESRVRGCAHARPGGKRQVLFMDIETLRDMDLSPGIIRENITTEGIDVNALRAGQRLRVGEAELEVSVVCEPCELMEEIRPGLMTALVGRRGMMCRVVKGGMVRQGDEVVVGSMEPVVDSRQSTVNSGQRERM